MTSRLIPVQPFDVADLPDQQRFPAMAAAITNSRLTRLSDGPFSAHARFWRMEPLVWSEQWLDPLSFDRDEQLLRSTRADHYQLTFVLEGECVLKRRAKDISCVRGDAILTDLTRTELVHATRQHSVVVLVPRAFLDEALPPVEIHGRLPRNAAGRLLFGHMESILAELPELSAAAAPRCATAFRDLLAATLVDLPPRIENEGPPPSVRLRTKTYIAGRPTGAIDVGAMCAALGISRAALYRAFKDDGGVLAYDRRRRLVEIHRALADPKDERSLTQVGFAFGFEDKSHLSHAFRDEFGYSASDLKNHVSGHPQYRAAAGSVQDRYRAAVVSLV